MRTILHADLNNCFASIESISHPEYRKIPFAVGGDEEMRHGIILAKNEIANDISISSQKHFDDNSFDALTLDTHTEEKIVYLTFDIWKVLPIAL